MVPAPKEMNDSRSRRLFNVRPSLAEAGSLIAVLLVTLGGCATSRLSHFDGHPFTPLFEIRLSEYSWLAVDSCDTGIHALVEVETEPLASNRAVVNPFPERPIPLTLVYDAGKAALMRFGRLEGPICIPSNRELTGYGSAGAAVAEPACYYAYRAEFNLRELPDEKSIFEIRQSGRSFLLARR